MFFRSFNFFECELISTSVMMVTEKTVMVAALFARKSVDLLVGLLIMKASVVAEV